MAYVTQQIPENEENKFGRTDQTTPNPLPPQTGGSSGDAGGAGGQVAPGFGSPTQFGSNAAKLSDYLKANQGQTMDFANKISGDLGEGFNKTQNAINQGVSGFNQQVNQGYTPYDQTKANQAASNPTEFVKNPDNVKSFQSMYNDSYKGPENFESSDVYSNLNNEVGKSVENAGLLNNFSGLKTYLGNQSPNATEGMKTLDTALLTRNPQAQQAITAAATPFKGLSDYLGGKVKEADQGVASAKNTANQTSQTLQNQFTGEGGVIPKFQQDLNNRLTQGKQNFQTQLDTATRDFKNGQATPADLKVLGMDPENLTDRSLLKSPQTAQILNNEFGIPVDLGSYITSQNPDVLFANPNAVANSGDVAYQQALNQLTGGNLNAIDPNASLGLTNPVNVNRDALGGLGQQLGDADANRAWTSFQAIPGSADIGIQNQGNFLQWLGQDPSRPQYVVDNVRRTQGDAAASQLVKSFSRLGFNIAGGTPPPTGVGGTVVKAS